MPPLSLLDMREICVFWNVEECPNWDRRFQDEVTFTFLLASTETQVPPELIDEFGAIVINGDKDEIAIWIVHSLIIWAMNNLEPSVSTLMLISHNLSEETLTVCLALKVRGYNFLLLKSDESVEDASVEYLSKRLMEIQKKILLEEEETISTTHPMLGTNLSF